jgi:outer membrane protein
MKILKIIPIIFFILLINTHSYGQNIRILSLTEAISLALSNNSDLITAKYERVKAQKKVSETYNESLFPAVNLNTRYNRAFKKQVFDIFGQKYEIGNDNQITNSLDVTQTIPFLGAPVFSGIRIAEYYAKLQDELIASIEAKTKTDVKKSFYNVLLLKEFIYVNELSLKNAADNLSVVEARYRNGVATEFDYLRAKVKLENIEPGLSQLYNNLNISKLALKNVIGLKDKDEIDVTGKLDFDTNDVYDNIDKILNHIAEKNVSIRQLTLSKQINQEVVNINSANYLPKLYLFGQYQLNASENDGKSFFNYRYYNVINAGVGLTWNLNLIRNTYAVNQAEIDVKKVDEQIIDVKQKLRIQAKSILLRMEDARKRMKSQTETIKLAEKGYEIAQISYKNGVLNQIDVLDAEFMLNQSRLGYLQAIFDYLTAKSELEGLLEI